MKKYSLLVCKLLILFVAVCVLTFVDTTLRLILNNLCVTYEQYCGLFLFSGLAFLALFYIGIGVLLCFLVHKLPFFRTGYRVLPRKQIFWVIFSLALGFLAHATNFVNWPWVELEQIIRVPVRFIFDLLPFRWNEEVARRWISRAVPSGMSCLICIGVFIGYELFSLFAVKRMQSQKAQG